ncbi:MAG: hypothetical protein ACK44T_13840, partial [Sphingomonadales bacterium]
MLQCEADIGPCHGESPDGVERCSIFCARAAQEFAPRRNVAKKIFDSHARPRRNGRRPLDNE